MVRAISPAMQEHLESGATTLCTCWRVQRRDGVVMGFTDHDRDLEFGGTIYAAETGLDGSACESNLGLATSGADVKGVLDAASISADDIHNGAYDNASVEQWRVNWADSEQRLLMDVAVIGEISHGVQAFTAELRSLAHEFDQERGRLYQSQCSADLADAQCGFAVSGPPFEITANVTQTLSPLEFLVDASGFDDGWFTGGRITFNDGDNAGRSLGLNASRQSGAELLVTLWNTPPAPVIAGVQVSLRAGCDKSFATCRSKFANHLNFRGFPHIPGDDLLMAHAGNTNLVMDGGSLIR